MARQSIEAVGDRHKTITQADILEIQKKRYENAPDANDYFDALEAAAYLGEAGVTPLQVKKPADQENPE